VGVVAQPARMWRTRRSSRYSMHLIFSSRSAGVGGLVAGLDVE